MHRGERATERDDEEDRQRVEEAGAKRETGSAPPPRRAVCRGGVGHESAGVGGAQPVADAANRLDHPGAIAELLAKAAHVHFDEIRSRIKARFPHLGEELAPRGDLVHLVEQVQKKCVLSGSYVERLVLERDPMGDAIDFQLAASELRKTVSAPNEGAYAGNELFDFKRFDEVIIRAGVEADDLLLRLAAGGEHQDRGDATRLPKFANDFQAIAIGKHPVDDEEIVETGPPLPNGIGGVFDQIDGVSLLAEHADQETTDFFIVFDNENFHAADRSPKDSPLVAA